MSEERGSQSEQPAADDGFWAAIFNTEEAGATDQDGQPPDFPFTTHLELPPIELPTGDGRADGEGVAPDKEAAAEDPWELAQRLMDADEVLEMTVSGHNKGGLLVHWNGLPGFIPTSQILDFPAADPPRRREPALAEYHGRKLQLKIIELNKLSNRLILSERATRVAAEEKQLLWSNIHEDERREGIITTLADFGAFVDLGGVEGMVHKSEISWSRVSHPADLLQPGQRVEVLVLKVVEEQGHIGLSLKRLRPDPWLTAEARYKPRQEVTGVVGNVTTFGAFVTLEPELEGLVHISELAEGIFKHPRDVVNTGDVVVARVMSVDAARKRIALSLRRVDQDRPPQQ